ncbi:Bug family tripartite tricarboxylate transporter substrate binding protein [Polaromonas eurypsychrophila]
MTMRQKTFQRRSALALLTATVLGVGLPALAQGKITRIVVAFPSGGPVDFVARAIGEQLGKELGHQVIVENKAGANGAIAAEYVARSAPDGQTLWLTSVGAVAINPPLYDKLPYDPVRDLAPVSLVVNNVELLVVNATNPANTGAEFVANARQQSKGATMASSGIGSVPHLAMELLADATQAKLLHVPYKGAAPAITDVVAGHVDGFFGDIPGLIGFVKAGKLKPIGIAAAKRHPLLPEVKTFDEMGIKGVDSDNWYALFASKATPAADIERLNGAVRRTLGNEAVAAKLMASGAVPAASSPVELATLLRNDTAKWARVIKAKNIKPE